MHICDFQHSSLYFLSDNPHWGKKQAQEMIAVKKEKRKDLNSDEMIIFIALKKNISLNGCQTHLQQYTQDGGFLNKVVKKQRDGHGLSGMQGCPSKSITYPSVGWLFFFKIMVSCIAHQVYLRS